MAQWAYYVVAGRLKGHRRHFTIPNNSGMEAECDTMDIYSVYLGISHNLVMYIIPSYSLNF